MKLGMGKEGPSPPPPPSPSGAQSRIPLRTAPGVPAGWLVRARVEKLQLCPGEGAEAPVRDACPGQQHGGSEWTRREENQLHRLGKGAGLFSSTECRSLGQCDKPTVSYRYLYLVLFGASHGPGTLLYVLKTLYHLIFIPALCGRCCYHPFSKMRNHSAGHLPSRAQLGNCKRGCG